MPTIRDLQSFLGVVSDGVWGPKSQAALDAVLRPAGEWQIVKASSFADPKDIVAFDRCKATGKTDLECFAVGDNGIGKWGHKTAQEDEPMAALPRGVWGDADKKGGAKIEVRYKGKTVAGILGDTLPAKPKHGVGIDLNPAFAKRLGLNPPFMVEGVEWRWA